MKIKVIVFAIFALSAFTAGAQYTGNVAYINTDTILNRIPEYVEAQKSLNSLAELYRDEIESKYKVIEQMYNSYMSSKSRMTEYQQSQKENEIIEREREVKELQNDYFGPEGVMQEKSEELLSPIRERIQQVVDKIATSNGIMLIFDTAIMQGVIYNDPSKDLSDTVLKELGL